MKAFAGQWADSGHTVHTPDLFDARTSATLQPSIDFVREIGCDNVLERRIAAAEAFSPDQVYAGFSLGSIGQARRRNAPRPGTGRG